MRIDAKIKRVVPTGVHRRCRTADWSTALMIAPTLLVSACSSGLIGAPKTPPAEIQALKQQVVELQRRATVAELEGGRLRREITRLETELKNAKDVPIATRAGREDTEVEPIAPAVIALDQEIEETDLEEAPLKLVPSETGSRLTEHATAPIKGAVESAAQEPETPAEPDQIATSTEAQALYDEGYTLFHQKRYADAEARFSRFVELHPRTDLADNALFWVGESRYARGELSSALEAFSGTVERYPHGNKVGDALLKAGKCLESLGDTQQARRTYEEVMSRYPGSSAAAQARDRLGDLR